QQSRFSAAARSHHEEHFALGEIKVHALHHGFFATAEMQITDREQWYWHTERPAKVDGARSAVLIICRQTLLCDRGGHPQMDPYLYKLIRARNADQQELRCFLPLHP